MYVYFTYFLNQILTMSDGVYRVHTILSLKTDQFLFPMTNFWICNQNLVVVEQKSDDDDVCPTQCQESRLAEFWTVKL